MLKFKIDGQYLQRLDFTTIVADSRNYLYAKFILDSDWVNISPIVTTFNRKDIDNVCITVECEINGNECICLVPHEVLIGAGKLEITVQGGDLVTTNVVEITLLSSGAKNGLVPTTASPGLYGWLKDKVEALVAKISDMAENFITKSITADNTITTNLLTVNKIQYKDNSFYIESASADGKKAFLQMDKATGIRLLSNIDDKSDKTIKIGFYTDNVALDDFNGIYYNDKEGFKVGNGGDIILLTRGSGTNNYIRGNETLKILSNMNYLSFDSDTAGIFYKDKTWTEFFKQLDVFVDKGINMEAVNNSYWWVNAEKKAVYGNTLNKLEFRTDGVAKFSNAVSAPEYKISGINILSKVADKSKEIFDNKIKEYIAMTYDSDTIKLDYLIELSGGVTEKIDLSSDTSTVTAYLCENRDCYIEGEGMMADYNHQILPITGKNLANVYMLRGVTNIGSCCFCDCTSLEKVTIPGSVVNLGDSCFYGCTSLTNIEIPGSVTSLSSNCFNSCTNLTDVTIHSGVKYLDHDCFADCKSLKSIIIPDTIVSLGGTCFENCTNLQEIIIPGSVTILDDGCFRNCTKLQEVTMPDSITNLSSDCFSFCTSLTSIKIPSSITSININCFYGCTSLADIVIPNCVIYLWRDCFRDCVALKNIEIPDSVEVIDYGAFRGCTSLKSVIIPDNVTRIGENCFNFCTSLTDSFISNSVTSIGNNCFAYNWALKTITIDKEKDSIKGAPWGATNAEVIWLR